ncbi:MAG: NAD-dependent epimerase/dehydratase family protein [Anaerolineae bacterium]|nr:NAD-dependent epimerase/dehydratase family protein [Anaerolineae bacterium]
MKIFLTGATGFLGRSVLALLREHGHDVHCWVRPSRDLSLIQELDAHWTAGSLLDTPAIKEAMRGADALIHNAGVYSFWEPQPAVYEETNINGTFSVFSAAAEVGLKHTLLVSSAVIYGNARPQPFTESTPPGDIRFSRYADSKYFGELFARKIARERSLPLTIIQPGAIIGPGDSKASGAYVANVVDRNLPVLGLLNSIITFVHVNDVAWAIVSAVENARTKGETYLVGSQPISVAQYLTKISDVSGIPLPKITLPDTLILTLAHLLTFWADRRASEPKWGLSLDQARTFRAGFQFDGSKAERDLGLHYTPIDQAIEETVHWYLLHKASELSD